MRMLSAWNSYAAANNEMLLRCRSADFCCFLQRFARGRPARRRGKRSLCTITIAIHVRFKLVLRVKAAAPGPVHLQPCTFTI